MGPRVELTRWAICLKPISPLFCAQLRERVPGIKIDRDLAWLPVSPFAARALVTELGDAVEVTPEVERLASAADAPAEYKRLAADPTLPDPPSQTAWWPHQREAFYFFQRMYAAGFRGLGLFSELGSGKSKIAVGLADWLGAQLVLVVGPRSSMLVWAREFAKHGVQRYRVILPDLGEDVLERLRRVRVTLYRGGTVPVVVAINYEAVWRPGFGKWALNQAWDLVIADECHRVKDPRGQASLFMARLRDRARRRIALTGTPLHHSPLDAWALYRFLDPAVFGLDYGMFRRRYGCLAETAAISSGEADEKKPRDSYQALETEFAERIYAIAYRATGDVLQLPEAVHEVRCLPFEPAAAEVYRTVEREVIARIKTGEITIRNALERLMKLQELTSGFLVDDAGRFQDVGHEKELMFDEFLTDFGREPLVVFCLFHHDMDRVRWLATKHGLLSSEYSGRADELVSWQRGVSTVLVVQIRTGGESVDYTRARCAVYYSHGLSLGDYVQSLSRLHRKGQTRSVVYVHLLVRDSVDEHKMRFLERREDVIRGLLAQYGGEE